MVNVCYVVSETLHTENTCKQFKVIQSRNHLLLTCYKFQLPQMEQSIPDTEHSLLVIMKSSHCLMRDCHSSLNYIMPLSFLPSLPNFLSVSLSLPLFPPSLCLFLPLSLFLFLSELTTPRFPDDGILNSSVGCQGL